MYEKLNMTHAHRLAALQAEAKQQSVTEAKKKPYHEVTLKEILTAAGGLEGVKKHAKTDDEAYDYLMSVADKLIDALVKEYDEVGEPNTTKVQDWVDNNKFVSVHSLIVKELEKDPEVKKLKKAYEDGGYKDDDSEKVSAYVKPLLKKKFPKFGGELWMIVNDLLGINY